MQFPAAQGRLEGELHHGLTGGECGLPVNASCSRRIARAFSEQHHQRSHPEDSEFLLVDATMHSLEARQQGHPYPASTYRQVDAAALQPLRCFHVMLQQPQPLEPGAAFKAKQHCRRSTLGALPLGVVQQGAATCRRRPEPRHVFRGINPHTAPHSRFDGALQMDPGPYGYWPTVLEARPAPHATAIASALPAAKAVAAGAAAAAESTAKATFLHGITRRAENPAAVRGYFAARREDPHVAENARGRTPSVAPHYWSPAVYTHTNAAGASSRTGELVLAASATDTSSGRATGQHVARATVCARREQSTRAPGATAAAVGAATAPKTAKRSVMCSGSTVSRRQPAAAKLTEVVRIDDSSDEESASAPSVDRAVAAPVTKALAVNEGRGLGLRDQLALEDFAESKDKPRSSQPSRVYVVFGAALVSGDGRCCLLTANTVCKAAEQSADSRRQQESSPSVEVEAAAVVPEGEGVNNEFKADDRLLVLQAYQDERGVSLDLWKPLLLGETPDCELSCNHANTPVTPAATTDNEDLSNILSFSTKSICQMRSVSLYVEDPDLTRSRRSTSKEICHRCGRGRNRSKVRTPKEETHGRDNKHHKGSLVRKEKKDSATVEVSVKTSRHTSGKLHVSRTEENRVASLGVNKSDARKDQPVTVVETTAPAAACDKDITRRISLSTKAKKFCAGSARDRRASGRSGSNHKPRSEGRKEFAELRVASGDQPRHGRSQSSKSCSTHHSGKGAHTKRSGPRHPKEDSPSARAKRRIKRPASPEDFHARSDQQGQKDAAPINALAVFSMKPPRANLQLQPDSAVKPEASPQDSTSWREEDRGVDVNPSTMPRASSAEGSCAESKQSTHQGLHNSSSRKENEDGSSRKHSTTRGTHRTHRSGEKAKCCSSCHKSRSCSLRSDSAYSREAPVVSVLCLELQRFEAGGLQCSKLVQSMLKTSSACTLSTQDQHMRERPQPSGLETSRLSEASNLSSMRSDMAKQVCRKKAANSEDDSKDNKYPHRSRRRSRELARTHDSACRRCSGGNNSDPQKTHSRRKHHRSDDARGQPKSDASKSGKKRRRDASALTAVTASDSHKKTAASRAKTTLDSQRQCSSGSVDDSCRRLPTSPSLSALSDTATAEKSGGAVLPLSMKGNSERALCRSETVAGQQNATDYLHGDFCASGSMQNFILMLCMGPLLHDVGVAKDKADFAADNELDASSPPLDCTMHPVSKFVSVALQRQSATAGTTCSSQDLFSLCAALTKPLGGSGTLSGKPEELVDVATLAKRIAHLPANQREKAQIVCPSAQNSHQTSEGLVHLTNVLVRLVREGHELSESMRSSGSLNRNLPLEMLLRLWKSRVPGTPEFAVVAAAAAQKPAGSRSAASVGPAAALSSKEESAMATAAQAAASPPVFDLLLDDKTLRRLSGKEFLDDTIIDFCLGFIVDHILTPEERLRVHISNTFFLSALMAQICEVEGHSRLTRWLKKELTPLPKKDFIFIPVHHKDQHWSLAVVVYPWRALNCTSDKADNKLRQNSKMQRSEQAAHVSTLQSLVLISPSADHCSELDAGKASCSAVPAAKRRGGLEAGNANVSGSLPWRAPHSHRGSQPRARMFHVDSMGLRSVFDCCRGRLKRFLRREFDYRCGGTLKSGESAELCTESCCWQDGLSCALHTPRQQNGYDCGVFVVEYVYFLTRNLNAIELLLSGPTRDAHSYERGSSLSTPGCSFTHYAAPLAQCIKSEGKPETDAHGGRLETILGFSCPCMAVGKPVDPTTSSASSDLRLKPSEVKGTGSANIDTVSVDQLNQQQHLQPKPCPPATALHQRGSVNPQKLEPVHPSLMPYATIHAEEKLAPSQSCSLPSRLQRHGNTTPSETAFLGAAVAASTTVESARHSTYPPWGPLPYSFSKRRSAHTKWFSQDQVTQRRSQLLEMLLFMRQHAFWREDPKLIAHLKSLFLGVKASY